MFTTKIIKIRGPKVEPEALRLCTQAIQSGGVIVFPTDTVYGIACNAFDPVGIRKIYRLKGRSYTKPLPILLADADQLPLVAREILPETDHLIRAYWPGPLTLVLKTAPIALNASRGKSSIAVRVPDHGLVRFLLRHIHVPLATTSANRSGQEALTNGRDVRKLFASRVDVIIDGGECPVGRASSVVDATHYPFTILREGVISRLELTKRLNLG